MFTEKEKQEFHQKITSNSHEVFVVSFDEMDAIIRSSPNGQKASVQANWQKVKGHVEMGANYRYHAKDAVTVAKLVGDLGAVGTRAYIKTYGGKPDIILEGRPGLRTVLTGTKYGIKNPKVIAMGLGKSGAIAAARQGGIFTVVLLSVYRVADFFLTDQATLSQLIGSLATDVVKVGIATGAAILFASSAIVGTFAIGPIVAVVLVGAGTSMLLEYVDKRIGITDRIISGLEELEDNVDSYIDQKKREALSASGTLAGSVIDYTLDSARSIEVTWVRKSLREYLSPISGVR